MSGAQYVLNKWKMLLLLLKITSQMRKMRPHSAPSLGPAPEPILPTTKAQESMAQTMRGSHVRTLSFQKCMENTGLSQKNLFLLFSDSHLLCDHVKPLCLLRTQFHESFGLDQEFSNCTPQQPRAPQRGPGVPHVV